MERHTAPHLSTAWEDTMPLIIETSHRRSRQYGLRPDSAADLGRVPTVDLSLLLEQNRLLHTHAVPAMETLYQQIVNTHNMVDPNMPFGGFKASGVGREHGRSAIEAYTELKSVCIAY